MLLLLFLTPQYDALEGFILAAQFWFTFCWWKNILKNNSTGSFFSQAMTGFLFCDHLWYWCMRLLPLLSPKLQQARFQQLLFLQFTSPACTATKAKPVWWSNTVLQHYLYPGELQGVGCVWGDLKQNKQKVNVQSCSSCWQNSHTNYRYKWAENNCSEFYLDKSKAFLSK